MKIKKGDNILALCGGRQKIVVAGQGSWQSDFGILDLKKIVGKNYDSAVETTAGRKIILAKPQFYDLLANCRRGPAVILPKDFAAIVSLTGVGKDSVCVEIGTGSGWLTAQLANVCKKVVTYEIRKDFYQMSEKNFKFLGLKNVVAKNENAITKISEKDVDLITVDVPEPWQVLKSASPALRAGGYFVAYCPQITQAIELVGKLGAGWQLEKVAETLQREWKIETSQKRSSAGPTASEQGERQLARPEHQMLGHTAFLVVIRKY
ncbi:MAG: methyltransferase domain-containing protein [DPANN group archaeon]|nr:methyltransferase domain-containing protein [DPANN group archaeon]